ncbi:TPA: ead/Ea22-like family protein [Escherichia coli]
MSNIDKHALNQEKIEWLNKLADMEYCKSNPGHWLMSLKDTNMLAKLALHSVALLDKLEAAEKLNAELMEKQRLIDICQGQGLEHRIAAEKRAEAAEKRIAEQRETLLAARSHVMHCARLGDAHANGVLQAIDRAAADKGEAS